MQLENIEKKRQSSMELSRGKHKGVLEKERASENYREEKRREEKRREEIGSGDEPARILAQMPPMLIFIYNNFYAFFSSFLFLFLFLFIFSYFFLSRFT